MPYSFQPSVITARRRHGAQRVFLTEADCWSPVIAEAEVIEDEAHGDIRLLEAEMAGAGMAEIRLARIRADADRQPRLIESEMSAA